jgi:hypothetical protein
MRLRGVSPMKQQHRPAVAILEDDPARIEPMRGVLKATLPTCERRFFGAAPEMIAWLAEHLVRVVFVSLDHDLDSVAPRSKQAADPGCGRDVADWLARQPPICPVFVHTTNQDASVGMLRVLLAAGWPTHRVYPRSDIDWVTKEWADDLLAHLRDGWIQLRF